MSITVDSSGFEKALKETLLRTSRVAEDVLNGTAIEVITTAAKLTPKADKASIPYTMYREVTNNGKSVPIIWLILNSRRESGKGLNNNEMRTAAKKLIGRRVSAIGFNAYAGWQKALLAVGGRGFGREAKQAGFEKSSAARGSGRKATAGNLMAIGSNTAAWIEHIGQGPLQQALDMSEARMLRHLEEKLQKALEKL